MSTSSIKIKEKKNKKYKTLRWVQHHFHYQAINQQLYSIARGTAYDLKLKTERNRRREDAWWLMKGAITEYVMSEV